MCLTLPNSPVDELDTVYKIYKVDKKLNAKSFNLSSLWQHTTYKGVKKGTVISSNRRSAALTKTEKLQLSINKGIHVFIRFDDALEYVTKRYNGEYVVVRALSRRSKRVATGSWDVYQSAVYTDIVVDKLLITVNLDTKTNTIL